jgi:argininosuccinate lyase
VVGRVVRQALESKTTLAEAVRSDPELGADFASLLRPGAGVARRITAGGAGTDVVATQLAKAQGRSAELHRSWL